MPWFRVDDCLHSHPKLAGVSFAARGLWVTAGSWCGQHLTDGHVPSKMLRTWSAPVKLARELVNARLWHETPEGYVFHQWEEHQPTRGEVQKKRMEAQERMSRVRNRSREQHANQTRTTREPTETFALPLSRPDPTRPDPTEGESAKSLQSALGDCWDGVGGASIPGTCRVPLVAAETILRRLRPEDPVGLFREAVARFRADAAVKRKRLGLPILLGQLEVWCEPDAPAAAHSRPASHAEHAAALAVQGDDFDRLGGGP